MKAWETPGVIAPARRGITFRVSFVYVAIGYRRLHLHLAQWRPTSDAWIAWAMRVSVRRLHDDVDCALLLYELNPEAFARTTGLPADACERVSAGYDPRVFPMDVTAEVDAVSARIDRPTAERQIGAHSTDSAATSLRFVLAPRPVAHLVRAVLSTVRRAIERQTGRLPSATTITSSFVPRAAAMNWRTARLFVPGIISAGFIGALCVARRVRPRAF